MSIRVKIESEAVERREITIKNGPKAGQISTFYEQEGYAFLTDRDGKPRAYPERITLNIDHDRGQKPYPVGNYVVGDASFWVDRFRSLQLGRPVLVAVPNMQRAA